jgi:hypothetical protein
LSGGKKAVFVTGGKGAWFEQALFIVQDDRMDSVFSRDALRQAEQCAAGAFIGRQKIVRGLPVSKKTAKKSFWNKRNPLFGTLIHRAMLAGCGVWAGYLMFCFYG